MNKKTNYHLSFRLLPISCTIQKKRRCISYRLPEVLDWTPNKPISHTTYAVPGVGIVTYSECL